MNNPCLWSWLISGLGFALMFAGLVLLIAGLAAWIGKFDRKIF